MGPQCLWGGVVVVVMYIYIYVVLNLIGPRVHLTKCSLGESSLANGPPGEVSKGQNSMGQNVLMAGN